MAHGESFGGSKADLRPRVGGDRAVSLARDHEKPMTWQIASEGPKPSISLRAGPPARRRVSPDWLIHTVSVSNRMSGSEGLAKVTSMSHFSTGRRARS